MDTAIRELLHGQKLVTLGADYSVERALTTLTKHKILSAPVMSAAEPDKPLGFVDMVDLVAFLSRHATKPLTHVVRGESRNLQTDDAHMMQKRAKDFLLSHVEEAINVSKRNPYFTIDQSKSLREALELFKSRKVHRFGVIDSQQSNRLVGVLTQSQVLNALARHLSEVPQMRARQAAELMTTLDNMHNASPRLHAIDAFLTMHERGLSDLSILLETGELANVISASDLKTLGNDMQKLLLPVLDYVSQSRQALGRTVDLVAVTPDTNFDTILHKIIEHKVHRVFVVDQSRKPLGVISLSDLLQKFGATPSSMPV